MCPLDMCFLSTVIQPVDDLFSVAGSHIERSALSRRLTILWKPIQASKASLLFMVCIINCYLCFKQTNKPSYIFPRTILNESLYHCFHCRLLPFLGGIAIDPAPPYPLHLLSWSPSNQKKQISIFLWFLSWREPFCSVLINNLGLLICILDITAFVLVDLDCNTKKMSALVVCHSWKTEFQLFKQSFNSQNPPDPRF